MVTVLPYKYPKQSPTVVEVGDPQCGIIEIPRYDSVTPAETHFITENTKDLPDPLGALCKMVDTIAKTSGIEKKEIWKLIQNNQVNDLFLNDPQGMAELRKIQEQVAGIRQAIVATAVLKSRLPECRELTIEQVLENGFVHPRLLRHLEEFYQKELNGWPDESVEDVTGKPVKEDQLKKILPEEDQKK